MNFKRNTVLLFLFISMMAFSVEYKEVYDLTKLKSSKEIINFIKSDLLTWVNNDIIVNSVIKANEKNAKRTQEEINKIDKEWMASKEITPLMKEYLTNDCAKFLTDIEKKSGGLIAEIFVMDYQGCIVGEADKTSDFWQGDEDKFIKTYEPKTIFIDKIKFDESSKTSSMQISLPIFNAKTKKVIGAITVTLNMEKKELLKK